MTTKEFGKLVNNRNYIERSIERIKAKIEQARERAEKITAKLSQTGHVSAGVSDPVGDAVAEIDYYTRMLEDYENTLARENLKIEKEVEKIGEKKVKLALQLKYVDKLTWFQVADKLGDNLTGDGARMLCTRYFEKNS